jgi:hypothetical protein
VRCGSWTRCCRTERLDGVPPHAVRVGERLLPKPIGGHPALPATSRTAAGALGEVRSFRAALYGLLVEGTGYGAVAERVDEANALRRLTAGPAGAATPTLPPSRDVRLPLHSVALAAALLARPERATNRAKVRAHAARQK